MPTLHREKSHTLRKWQKCPLCSGRRARLEGNDRNVHFVLVEEPDRKAMTEMSTFLRWRVLLKWRETSTLSRCISFPFVKSSTHWLCLFALQCQLSGSHPHNPTPIFITTQLWLAGGIFKVFLQSFYIRFFKYPPLRLWVRVTWIHEYLMGVITVQTLPADWMIDLTGGLKEINDSKTGYTHIHTYTYITFYKWS